MKRGSSSLAAIAVLALAVTVSSSAGDIKKQAVTPLRPQAVSTLPRCPAGQTRDARCLDAAGSDQAAAAACPCKASTVAQPTIKPGITASAGASPSPWINPAKAPAPVVALPAAPVTCPATKTKCGSTCVDLVNDPHNCGRCSNQCISNVCSSGVCRSP